MPPRRDLRRSCLTACQSAIMRRSTELFPWRWRSWRTHEEEGTPPDLPGLAVSPMPLTPTYEPAELVMLALMLVALGVTLAYWSYIRQWRFARLACLWFVIRLAASVFTVAEGRVWNVGLNVMEHSCYALAAVVAVVALTELARFSGADGK